MSRSCAVAVVVIMVPRQFGTALTGGEPAAVTVIVQGGNEIAGRAPRLRFVAEISHGPALIVISVVVVRCCDTWDSELPAAATAVIVVVVMVGVVGSSEEPKLPVVAAALVVVIVVVVMVGVAGSSEELNLGESEKTGLRHVDGVPAIAAAAVPVVKPSSSSGGIRKGNNNLEIAMQSPHDATQKVHASTAHLAHTFTDLEWAKL
ncbi:hypothetical protein H4582DRAFT_2053735 [Lactarius indigo]|nr:hypothetical protein H4582DRAFT_2053735 [Lactarius indigo]